MVDVKLYRVRGVVKVGDYENRFSIEVPATRAYEAVERARSQLGSWYGVKRKHIKIEAVERIEWDKAKRSEVGYLKIMDRILTY